MKNRYLLLLAVALTVMSSMVYANVGIPTIALVVPFFWLAFIPVVFIETLVMRRAFMHYSFGRLLLFNTASNASSTFVGIPIAYLLMYVVSPMGIGLVSWGNEQNKLSQVWSSMLALGEGSRQILLSLIVLCVLFFVISVLIERWVFSKFLNPDYNRQLLTKEVIKANIASYVFLLLGMPALILLGALLLGFR